MCKILKLMTNVFLMVCSKAIYQQFSWPNVPVFWTLTIDLIQFLSLWQHLRKTAVSIDCGWVWWSLKQFDGIETDLRQHFSKYIQYYYFTGMCFKHFNVFFSLSKRGGVTWYLIFLSPGWEFSVLIIYNFAHFTSKAQMFSHLFDKKTQFLNQWENTFKVFNQLRRFAQSISWWKPCRSKCMDF